MTAKELWEIVEDEVLKVLERPDHRLPITFSLRVPILVHDWKKFVDRGGYVHSVIGGYTVLLRPDDGPVNQ